MYSGMQNPNDRSRITAIAFASNALEKDNSRPGPRDRGPFGTQTDCRILVFN